MTRPEIVRAWTLGAVLAAFTAFYASLGLALARTGVLETFDVLFQADTPRVIGDLTSFGANHYRTKVHPLFVLLFNPPGVLIASIFGTTATAIAMTSLAGAACVVLAAIYFERAGLPRGRALAYAVIVGLSASHVLLSTVPDTFVFSAMSLIILAIVTMDRAGRAQHGLVPATVLALGMTTTNLVDAVLLAVAQAGPDRAALARTARSLLAALAIAGALSFIQRAIYPSAALFFVPEAVGEDVGYLAAFHGPLDVLHRVGSVGMHMLVYPFAAPRLRVWHEAGTSAPFVGFVPWSMAALRPAGIVAALTWLGLVGVAVARVVTARTAWSRTMTGLALCLAFDALLFTLYGDDLFLYSPLWTFQLVALVALSQGVRAEGERAARMERAIDGALALLIVAEAVNSVLLMLDVLAAQS